MVVVVVVVAAVLALLPRAKHVCFVVAVLSFAAIAVAP